MELMLGAAATAGSSSAAATAATAGLFGAGGKFALAQTLATTGTFLQGVGSFVQGKERRDAAKFSAAQMDLNAKRAEAAGQKEMKEELRQNRLRQSRARALAASSGGGATDPTVVDIHGDLEEDGRYRALSALHQGNIQAADYRSQASITRWQGRNAYRGGIMGAGATFLEGASGLKSRYSRRGA